jgi:hypothetical protein
MRARVHGRVMARRLSQARGRANAGGSATVVDRSGSARRDGPKKQEKRQAPSSAWKDGGDTCKIASQLARRPTSHSASAGVWRRTRRSPSAQRPGHP